MHTNLFCSNAHEESLKVSERKYLKWGPKSHNSSAPTKKIYFQQAMLQFARISSFGNNHLLSSWKIYIHLFVYWNFNASLPVCENILADELINELINKLLIKILRQHFCTDWFAFRVEINNSSTQKYLNFLEQLWQKSNLNIYYLGFLRLWCHRARSHLWRCCSALWGPTLLCRVSLSLSGTKVNFDLCESKLLSRQGDAI